MATAISATDAVRKFSELLNAVRYQHDSFTIIRGGKPAAAIVPVESVTSGKSLKELGEILRLLPRLKDDNESFARDIKELVSAQPAAPEKLPWE
ncbi:MAG: type II toxin-antitoxin system prevent-host-death family antitoxin [Nitrospira bacterium HGW-Nitrospira-1]|nr:MAG: type II toxin-antitoxin system prevent-host-death family antitoxin [Nitrospira bacterium HGW-Nitrospira-1]